MTILAVNAYAHNAAAALYDGAHAVAAEQERFDGVKKSGAFPRDVIDDVLLSAVPASDIDVIAYPWKPSRFAGTYLKVFCNDLPRSLALIDPRASPRLNIFSGLRVLLRLRSDLRSVLGRRLPRVSFVEHHLAHAANAFYSSSFDRALVLVADAFGDICSLSVFVGAGRTLRKVYENHFLESLGMLYACVTLHLGYQPLVDEGKVMALAALGDESMVEEFRRLVRLLPNGEYSLDFSYLKFHHNGERRPFTDKFVRMFGEPRRPGESFSAAHRNLARALQRTVEDALLHVVRGMHARFRIDDICFAGGLAMNCVANGRVLCETGVRAMFVPPAPDDSGAVLGAAQAVAHLEFGLPRGRPVDRPDLGPDFGLHRVKRALDRVSYPVVEPPDMAAAVAKLVADGKIVGWFQGRMEFGPRALGYRSLLGDPRRGDLRARLNAIKRREDFRPYAPAILAEHTPAFFGEIRLSPFMSFAGTVAPSKRALIPGAIHVDGTARVQTLAAHDPNPLRRVIEEFNRLTGVPCVVNTSLNCQTPIVATPEHALACMTKAQFDALALGPYLVTRPPESHG